MSRDSITLSFCDSKEIISKVEKIAEERGTGKSSIIREALRRLIKEEERRALI